jgi:hypothetical protein
LSHQEAGGETCHDANHERRPDGQPGAAVRRPGVVLAGKNQRCVIDIATQTVIALSLRGFSMERGIRDFVVEGPR